MRSRKTLPGAALCLCLLPLIAAEKGLKLADIDVVCPLFGHRFTAQAALEDREAAVDSDLCKRAPGASPYVLAVWTCPYCFFSAYQADFEAALEPRFRDLELKRYPVNPARVRQVDIFVGTKYLNAETFYRAQGKDARFLADLTLRGSYACRIFALREPAEFLDLRRGLEREVRGGVAPGSTEEANLTLAGAVRARLDAGEVPTDRARVYRYLLADALRHAGNHLEAGRILEELHREGRLPDLYLETARQKAFLCAREGMFQEKAIAYFRQAEQEGLIPSEEKAVTTYLQAELCRRLGRAGEARSLYHSAAGIPTDHKWLAALIRKQMDRLPPAEDTGAATERPTTEASP